MLEIVKAHKIGALCIAALFLVINLTGVLFLEMVPKKVTVVIDGAATTSTTKSYSIDELLAEKDIDLVKEDVISQSEDRLVHDGMKIDIKKSVPFTLQADGKIRKLRAQPKSIKDTLEYHKVKLGKDDKVSPSLDAKITAGSDIVINRITYSTKDITENVAFKTTTKNDDTLSAGTKKVVKQGIPGKDKVRYRFTYSDGKIIAKNELSRTTIKKAIRQIVAKGSRGTISGSVYKRKFTVKAYSYSGGGITASGTRVGVGSIAVDPRVIPLGTKVYVEGYGFATAEDTGGNIKGNTIDVYKNSSAESSRWGVRYVTIYIL